MIPLDNIQPMLALAGLRQFFVQPRSVETLELLLLSEVGGIANIELEDRALPVPVIAFELRDSDGNVCLCRCNPAGFALLLLIIVCGQSVFIDYTRERPYVKVFGRKSKSAGTVFGRLLAGVEAKENCAYANGNTLDLTFANIIFGGNNPRTSNGMLESYGEIAYASADASNALFPGNSEEKVRIANNLLKAAFERVAEEREAALSA